MRHWTGHTGLIRRSAGYKRPWEVFIQRRSISHIFLIFLVVLIKKMKLFAATLSLLSLASAGPLQQRQSSGNGDPFVLNIRWSNSPLKGPINANGSAFWSGKPTASYCPDNVPGCKEVDTTSFVGRDGNLFLNTGVPGGQQGMLCSLLFPPILYQRQL